MKNFNLIKRLWTDSHEKQKPQRFGRYATMLIMLLTLGVGQMWATDFYVRGWGGWDATASNKMTGTSSPWTFTAHWGSNGEFKIGTSNWSTSLGKKDAIAAFGTKYELSSDGGASNLTFPSLPTGGGVYTITVTYESSKYYIKVDKVAEEGNSWIDINAPKIYWDNTNANYSNVTMLNGRVWAGYDQALGSMASSLTHITGTNLWYNTSINNEGNAGKYTTTMFLNADWSTWETNVATQRATYATSYTATNNASLNSNTYLFSAANGNKGATLSRSQLSGGYSELNKTQTIEVYVKAAGGSYTKKTSSWPGTLTPDRYYLSNATTATHVDDTPLTASSSVTVSAVLTSAFSLSESSTATGYNFDGWGTSSSATPSGKNAPYSISAIRGANTICAFFSEKTYTVTVNNDGHGTTSPSGAQSNKGQITGVAISADPDDDYEFVNWTIESGTGSFGDATSESTTFYPTSAATIQANFRSTATNSLTVAAGTHVGTVTGSTDPVTLGNSYAISASNFDTGYEFDNWTASPAANATFANASSASTNVTVKNGSVTVTANARERMSSLTTSNYYDAGNPSYAIPTKTNSSIGISTTATITATTPSTGYTFAGWTLSDNIVVTSGDKDTDLSITVRTNGNGTAATAQAKYNEVLTSTYYLVGNNLAVFPGPSTWTADNANMLRKPSGSSTGNAGSITVDVKTIPANNSDYQFKIHESTGNKWWGWSTTEYYYMNGTKTTSLYDNQHNLYFIPNALGDYTFSVDWSNANEPSLTVTFPATTYTVNFGYREGGSSVTATYGGTSFASGTKVQSGKSVTFTYTKASGYNFAGWYNASTGGSKVSSDDSYTTTISGATTIYAAFTPITYNSGVLKKNGGDEDGSYSVTYMGTSITPSAPTKTGYHVDGYYAEAGTSTHIATAAGVLQNNKSGYTDATGHWNYAGVKDLYAKWAANTYTEENNIDGNSGSNGKYTATYDATSIAINTAPTRTGYNLTGYHAWGREANTLANTEGALSASQSENGGGKTLTNSSSQWIYDGSDATIYADWSPKTYDITLDQEGGASGSTSVTMTYDASTHTAITNPSKTGYTFAGYWTGDDGTGSMVIAADGTMQANVSTYTGAEGIWKKDATCTLYAKWTANNYTVTMSTESETGYGSGAPDNQTATYDAAMPTITPPVGAPGYKFQGYFTAANGAGTQYYNADGTSAHTWDIASATTLHAHFQKTVISTLEHPASIAKGDVVTLDVNPVLNQTGATNYMDICWSLLYDNDNPVESGVAVAANPVDGKPNQVRYTLTGLSAGYYKVKAVLKANASSFDACDAGTELSTIKRDLRIAGNSTVTIQYEDASGNTIAASTSVEVARGDSIGIKAPSIVGYTFSEWVLGDVLSSSCRNAATCGLNKDSINIKAEYDGVLIAQYARKNTIYFKNTLNWPAVYVNLLSSGFWNSNGSGNSGHANRNLEMTQLGTSDIWYYEYGNTTTTDYIAFTSQPQTNATNFWGKDTDPKVKVVYPTRPNHDVNERTAYGFHKNTPMFVPLAGQDSVEMNINNNGRAYYYNLGYWAKYEPISKETGYKLVIFNKKNSEATPDAGQAPVEVKSVPFTFDGDMTLPVSVTVDLEAGKWYGFKLYRDKGNSSDPLSWYGNSGNMSNKHSGDFSKGEDVWEFKTTLTDNCGLKTNSAGNYVFTLAYGKEAFEDSIQYLIGVHYPEATGDYRLVYSDDNRTGILSTTIPFESEADTLSFFVNKDASPKLALQKCDISIDGETSTVTWTDTIADLFSGGLPSAITKSGVYYFCINKDPETGKKVFGDTKLYEGNFYIRTDGATPSKWDNFRQNNHLMAYSDYAAEHENFTHSYTQWYDITNRKNVKFTVANDYSVSISDTLVREALEGQWEHINDYIDEKGDLNRAANVRFTYNENTNAISRAYIDGAYADGGNFLKILARTQDSIYAAAEGGAPLTEVTFTDNGNWLYEKTVFAQPGARYKLRSLFGTTDGGKHVITQYFKGGAGSTAADSATIIGGTGSSRMQIRLIYDFKTNRVVTAYQPSGTINDDLEIHADIMFMREHQGDIEQITFAEGKSISEIENIYCGLRFNKWTLNNKSKEGGHATLSPLLSRYERDIFYVSFPYDVRLSDVIGFGTYGQHWIVEYYDGAARAANGFWIDSDTYWKFVTPAMKDTFTLKAGTGYIVALDLDELYYIDATHHASIWDNTDITNLELLFPGKVSSISEIDVTYNVPKHTCTINRGDGTSGDRRVKDSHWNVLGVPTFKNITGVDSEYGGGSGAIVFANTAWIKDSMDLKFIYDGNLADNSLTPKAVKGFEFKAMHAYVVQYGGNVTFTTSATPAPAIVARRTYADKPQDVDFRLELNKNGVMEDQTFVSLSNDEDASAGFVFGEDLSKEFNTQRANIYTFIGTEWAAGNTLPTSNQTTIVPVGVKTAAEGEYTFSIPEGTYGVGITLIDNETGARTNLGLMDYTVNLSEGEFDNRFLLEISPITQSPTDIEAVSDQQSAVRKVMIDGILYIVKDGVVYDAQGKRVQ